MVLHEYAWIAPVVTATIGLVVLGSSFWTARSSNQRDLRERLRKQLREMNLACHIHFRRDGWMKIARENMPKFSYQALDEIHQDGLLSPNRHHIERVKDILHDIRDRAGVDLPKKALGEQYETLHAENKRRLKVAWETLDSEAEKYLRALGKMDNAGIGGYWTYLRYRIFRPRRYVNGPVGTQ